MTSDSVNGDTNSNHEANSPRDGDSSLDRDSLVEALEQARKQPPWTERLVLTALQDPEAIKAEAAACADCPAPCEPSEVCATMLAQSANLFEQVGRDQAFAHAESGIERLEIAERVTKRKVEGTRPNTFVSANANDI
ncbi:hypothetical protein ACLI4R_08325 [Natrialbaceae archaeon A-chndr2]